jgi:K+-sensing histidine kinase KdpD
MDHASLNLRIRIALISLTSLAAVSYIDWVTGYEFLLFVFYFIPVCICAWYLGRVSVLAMALLSGVVWFAVDYLSRHFYSSEIVRYWNSLTCFLAFAIIGLVLRRLRQSLREQLKARQELTGALEEISQANQEMRKLQGQLQVVCAWTKRIRVEGKWVPLDEFLGTHLHIPVSHGISPEALEEIAKSLK